MEDWTRSPSPWLYRNLLCRRTSHRTGGVCHHKVTTIICISSFPIIWTFCVYQVCIMCFYVFLGCNTELLHFNNEQPCKMLLGFCAPVLQGIVASVQSQRPNSRGFTVPFLCSRNLKTVMTILTGRLVTSFISFRSGLCTSFFYNFPVS